MCFASRHTSNIYLFLSIEIFVSYDERHNWKKNFFPHEYKRFTSFYGQGGDNHIFYEKKNYCTCEIMEIDIFGTDNSNQFSTKAYKTNSFINKNIELTVFFPMYCLSNIWEVRFGDI